VFAAEDSTEMPLVWTLLYFCGVQNSGKTTILIVTRVILQRKTRQRNEYVVILEIIQHNLKIFEKYRSGVNQMHNVSKYFYLISQYHMASV
jgi:molybdopterin-guanine dinucleotide biosynthesis protein